jgi:acetyltransferase
MDINPLLASEERLIALDARVVLHSPDTKEDEFPQLAIRPYPLQYVQPFEAKDGHKMLIRPIRPEDEPEMVEFHKSLSDETVLLRYARAMDLSERIAHERLSRISFIDYDRTMTLVVEDRDPSSNERKIIGVARLSKIFGTSDAQFAMIVADDYQGKGLGTELLNRLIDVGRDEGLERIFAEMLLDNDSMKTLCEKLGFEVGVDEEDNDKLRAVLEL